MHQAMTYPGDTEEWILAGYVLDALFEFGLIERQHGDEWSHIFEKENVRVTALWRKFISFGQAA